MIDVLTGLPDRIALLDTLEIELQRHAHRQYLLGVIVMNIHHFSNIRKLLGFRQADLALKTVSERLLDLKRKQDIAGRIGDHEFALLLPEMAFPTIAELAANRIIKTFDEPFTINDMEVSIKPTIGISLFPEHGKNGEELLITAEFAIRDARKSSSRYFLAEIPTRKNILSDERIELDLESAISNSEFELHYQPKGNLMTQRMTGAEALIRWHHRKHGTLSPGRFMPVAENSQMLLPITLWTLNTALHQATEIRKHFSRFRIAVNLSANLLDDPDLVEIVSQALQTWDTDPQYLVLEITESAMMRNPDACMKNLLKLNQIGVHLSIDDFGTGYSSFSYLKRMPVQELKIDQSFIRNILDDNNDAQIVQAIVNLGRQFKLRVVAEGIESSAVMDRLIEMGCEYGQGYLIARPLDFKQMLRWVDESEWNSTGQNRGLQSKGA
jgi:diguanylate cyclase (GGDEF)-like protein